MQVNEITFAGNLGRDAELKQSQSGQEYVTFSICHTAKKNDKSYPTWIQVNVFGNWCSLASTFKKGDNVIVKGSLSIREYEGKDGAKKQAVAITPYSLGKIDRGNKGNAQSNVGNASSVVDDDFSQIPF